MQLDFSGVELNYTTKEYILSKISPKEIFEFYLNHSINEETSLLSPFRKESNPSFTFKFYDDGHVLAKDWGTGENYDCFSFVQKLFNISFKECLKLILNNFRLESKIILVRPTTVSEFKEKKKNLIQIQSQIFTKIDIDYWKQYNIDLKTLVYFNVSSCKNIWLNDKLLYTYSLLNPIYSYKFLSYKTTSYKIYRPLAEKKFKWLFNGSSKDIEGYNQLPLHGDLLIITKSLKDVMCYYSLGYNAISLQGENNPLDPIINETLKRRFKNIIVNFDNDNAGNNGSIKLCKNLNLNRFIIPEELQTKDLSDTIKTYGVEYTTELLNSII